MDPTESFTILDDAQDEVRTPSPLRQILLATAAAAWACVALLASSGQDHVSRTAPAAATIPTLTPNAAPSVTTPPLRAVSGLGPAVSTPQTDPANVGERELTAEGMSREVNSWRWLLGAARGSWGPGSFGDELFLLHAPTGAGDNLRRGVGISLDSRIPEPDCNVGTPATPRELATWIGSRSWLSATPPRRVTLEGIDALEIDITAVPREDPPARCVRGDVYSQASGRFFIEVRETGSIRHPWVAEPGETIRLLLFDRFTGSAAPRTIAVTIQSPTESFDAMAADAALIVHALLSTLATYPD